MRFNEGLAAAILAAMTCVSAFALGADSDPVLARAGEHTVTASVLANRIGRTPQAQLALLASSAPGAKAVPGANAASVSGVAGARLVLDRLLVPEMLAAIEAQRRGLDKSPRVGDRARELLRQTIDQELKAEAIRRQPITPAEIREYYEANRSKYEQPPRIRIWRILAPDEASARALLDKVRAENRPAKWSDVARESSLDKATSQRQGDLGFVRPDGTTDVPRVQVNPALYQAAQGVKDGEFVPKPVPEGDKFAVIWRRGSLAATKRTLEAETGSIRQLLERQRTDAARDDLLRSLRAERVKDEKLELLDTLPAQLFGDKLARPRPVPSVRMPPPGLQKPEPTDDGLR